jgi:serine protease Do
VGSGFVIDPGGYVVTNHHVVDSAETIDITLSDGRTLPGKVVGIDPETDLALVKVEATGLPALKFGQSSVMKVGEPVMAIGNPFGLEHTVTVGIISGTRRVIGAGRYDDFLQTDAAINPGNSGGPLINTRGEVVGIASAIVSRTGGFQGVGFAIPADLAKPILGQLRTAGRVTRGWLGVSIQPLTPELAKSFSVQGKEGVLVASVVEDSPAAKAGIRAGDLILRYDDKPVSDPRALSSQVAGTPVGRTVEVQLVRDGNPQQLKVTIGDLAGTRQAAAQSPGGSRVAWDRLGVELVALTAERARQLGVGNREGVVVTEVKPDSPAAEAGLSEGDVIREVNRVPVASLDDVEKGLAKARDKQALLRVERDGGARYLIIEMA